MKAKFFFPMAIFLLACSALFSQTTSNIQQPTSINSDGSAPDASAILDVKSTTQGMLIPRVTTGQRLTISSPATSLLVFDTDSGSFFYYDGVGWVNLSGGDNLGNHAASQDLFMTNFKVVYMQDPTDPQDAATKNYVDANDDVNDADADATNELQDLNGVLALGTSAGNQKITNLSDPADPQDAATKNYVDTAVSGNVPDKIADADNNTRIQVEENPNEDTIRFDVGGVEIAKMDGKTFHLKAPGNSLFIGSNAGKNDDGTANENTFVGTEAGYSNTSGAANTFLGKNAGRSNNTGSNNTATGYQALYSNTSGFENTANGYQALYSNTTGLRNTATGYWALKSNTMGDRNTAYGNLSLFANTTGNENTALGYGALYSNTAGYWNIAVGRNALSSNTTGFSNIAIGFEALNSATGNSNTAVGNTAGWGNTGSGNVFLGNAAGYNATGNNKLFIENTNSNTPLIYGEFDNDRLLFNGRTGIWATNTGATLNVRGKSVDPNALVVQDTTGTDIFSVDNTGRCGLNVIYGNVSMAARGKSGDYWYFAVEGPSGNSVVDVFSTGNVDLSFDLNVVGTLSKGGGSFKIDHPLDPENKYLYHSFVESPDMMNVYNGNVTTDASGFATVELPDYFEALNRDFRYQLTVIGIFAQAIVKEKVAGNRFVIQTSEPNVEVSWQVTGIRHDPFANQNRIPGAVEKAPEEKGYYLHPAAYGLPAERGIQALRNRKKLKQ